MSNNSIFLAVLVLVCYSGFCSAFGAGNIPAVSFLEGKAFRHGDIEDILAEMLIRAATSDVTTGFGVKAVGKKFSDLNVKRVYFGNWLRDYSQAIDVGTVSKGLDAATIRILVWVFGFLSFGYATEEFEVTVDRLGVYRPEEHIDNPKDYADNVDARQFDPRLRGPVDPRELQIDARTGMKNYMANEQGGWVTSTAYIRDSLLRAIDLGRRAVVDADRYEALRLLGQGLHTLEDLTAHSNWIELALIELGYTQVFAHVGTNTQIQLPNGKRVWPMVTGTFGGVDFIHSLLGELTDHISQTSVTDLNAAITVAEHQNSQELYDKLKGLLNLVPSGQNDLEGIQQQSSQALGQGGQGQGFYLQGTQGEGIAVSAEEIVRQIYPIFALRDKIIKTVVTIPGLKTTVEEIKTTLTLYVLTLIQPFIKPILRLITENTSKTSALVMTDQTQYLVWNDPNSTDPTHSMLSKDHFSCYLNEPAGQVARIIIQNAVTQVVAAWSSTTIDPQATISSILQCFTHPGQLNPNSRLHADMIGVVKQWVEGLAPERKQRALMGLTRDGVRQGLHHDDERRKVEVQGSVNVDLGVGVGGTITSAVVGAGLSSTSSGRVSTAPSGITTSLGSASRGYSSGAYSTSTYQTSTYSSQRSSSTLIGTGTSYAQGMMTDYSPANSRVTTTEFRLWPYNMDYYTRQDEFSLKHLSPYYQDVPVLLQSPSIFASGQITYVQQSPTLATTNTTLGTTGSSTLLNSAIAIGGSGQGSLGGPLISNATGMQSPTSLPSSPIATSSPSSMFSPPSQRPSISQQTQSFAAGTSIPPSISPNATILPSTGPSTLQASVVPGLASTIGQGTNSSYYGQVNDHGQQIGSPVQTTASVSTLPAPVQGVTSMQNSMQNMNLNV